MKPKKKYNPKRALVISGGGARGAWGVGVAKALSLHEKNYYNLVVGTSTGTLMAPLVILRKFDILSKAYTSVTQSSIFNVNPFKKNGDIRYFLFAWRLICGKKTLGETKNLLKLINTFIKKEDFQKINNENLDFGAAVTSLTSNKVSIKTAKENSYEDMKEWMWASANEPVFMSTVYKDNEAWVDGGLKDYLPITYAIEQDVEEIDVIIHNGKEYTDTDWQQKGGIMDLLLRSISIYGANVEESDIMIAKLLATIKNRGKKEVKLNMYFMSPKQVEMTENELIFDKKIMEELLCQGYISVIDGSIIKESHSIRPSNK